MIERPDWHTHARCGRNGILGDNPAERVRIMFTQHNKTVCEGCPVRTECAQAGRQAARVSAAMGIWGGRPIGGRARTCAICDTQFTTSDRSLTCSPDCARERARRQEAERAREARLRQHADACCPICGRVRHDPACPNSSARRAA